MTESTEPVTSGGFLGHNGKLWQAIASWFVPLIMTIAYVVLALTSETDATGWAWMSIGLAFVLVMWWLFRTLTRSAAMSRAIAIGDVSRITQIDGRPIYRAIAHEMHGQWSEALAALATITPTKPRERVQVLTVRIGALVETGEVARARDLLPELALELARLDPRMEAGSHIAARLATGKVLTAERKHGEALAVLEQVIGDIRAGQNARALAHHYAARAAAADGQHAAADQHRARAAALAPTSWFVARS